jgi:formyl-CoA transferase
VVPSNTYRCSDGRFILIAANGDSLYKRLMHAIGRPDMADDPTLAHNDGRFKRVDEIDRTIEDWSVQHTLDDALALLHTAAVPAGKIYTAKDIAEDEHYRARGVIESVVTSDGLRVEMPGIIPKLSATPGEIRHRAPALGEHTYDVLRKIGLTAEQIQALKTAGVVQ